jgi:hypothetical protein
VLKEILGFDMSTPLQTYLLAQGELGGFDVVLSSLPLPKAKPQPEPKPEPKPQIPVSVKPVVSQDDSLWKNANNIDDFYKALQKHSVYTKSMRSLSFYVPKEVKTNAAFLLLFHSPQELTEAAKEVLGRLFKKLCLDLKSCAISFFFKCDAVAMPREKPALREMLYKEIELLSPEKIIFFREAPRPEKTETPAKANGTPITFAGKPAITLYSLLEMVSNAEGSKEKIIETWTTHLPSSGWFSPDIFRA